jgi:hypothetical protein
VDSLSAIIVITIAAKYTVTVTKKHIQVGCQLFTHAKALKMTKKQAEEKGLAKEYYDAYRVMIKGALKLIK